LAQTQAVRTARTRGALVRAAREEFVARGFGDAATTRIVAQAGVTRGALYHHFADKAALFAAVLADVADGISRDIQQRSAHGDNPWAGLEQACLALVEQAGRDGLVRLYYIDGPAVLGWPAWQGIDTAHIGALLRRRLQAVLDEGGAMHHMSLDAHVAMLTGALANLLLACAAGPPLRLVAEQAVLAHLRAFRQVLGAQRKPG